jgi:hypothetical protein
MTITIPRYVIVLFAIILLTILGWGLVGALMRVMRWHVGVSTKESWGAMDLWLGSAERLVAATLFALCVPALPAFIGGWIALKFAANWNRIKSEQNAVRKGALMAMIGSVASFTLAIVGGYLINPQAISCFVSK